MILGGVAQMLAPKAKTPDYRATDNGRQNTYFSSLDNMIARGTRCRCLTGKCWLAPAVYPVTSAPVMKAGRNGRGCRATGIKHKKIPQ